MSHPILFVGSIPGSSSANVLETLAAAVGPLAKRLPDGETGSRSRWIAGQGGSFANVAGLEPGQRIERAPGDFLQQYNVTPGAEQSLTFGPLGYAAAAIESYGEFKRLRAEGKIAAGVRFQVCLPTPVAVVMAFLEPRSIHAAWPAYERAMIKEIESIAAVVPAKELAVQWDIAAEPVFVLGKPEMLQYFPEESLVSSIVRASAPIPAEAELGLHMCFGDTGQKFSYSPDDLGDLTDFANRLVAALSHKVAWVHFPAPKKADYEKFFAPLARLKAGGAEIYIGLINPDDGLEGAKQRLDAVKRVVSNPGIATECGIGRRPPETLAGVLDLHKAVAALP